MKKNTRLAIASPSASSYSETFIRMQVERLPVILGVFGQPCRSETLPGGPIRPNGSLHGLFDLVLERALKKGEWWVPQAKELERRLRKFEINTLLANFGPKAVSLMPICKRLGIDLIVHFHGYDAHSDSVVKKYRADYLQLASYASAVIAVSGKMSNSLQEIGFSGEKIHIIRCGVDPKAFPERESFPDAPVFLGVGRFVDKKGPYFTLLAFSRIAARFPRARLILAGDGPLREVCTNLAEFLGVSSMVEFPGVIDSGRVSELMRESTAFVQHSIVPRSGVSAGDSEGTPVSVMEAMMTGLPVIATNHAGIGEIISDGETGLLCDERDVEGMARAMGAIAEDQDLARRLGGNAREAALVEHTADRYIEGILDLM